MVRATAKPVAIPGRDYTCDMNLSRVIFCTGRKELWKPMLRIWFAIGENDPNLALLKVDATQAEYWDARSPLYGHSST